MDHGSPATRRSGRVPGALFVTYCWGPHCNGAHRAAARIALLGHPVTEMIGGIHGGELEGLSLTRASAA